MILIIAKLGPLMLLKIFEKYLLISDHELILL